VKGVLVSEPSSTGGSISAKSRLQKRHLIFFILALAFVLRMYNVWSPLIGIHQWRQCETAAMSRNYYEHGYRFAYPEITSSGTGPTYAETEFPIYSFAVALLYKLFGVHESLGRLVSVLCSLVTIYFLYLLVRRLADIHVALWACLFYAILPLNVFYGRTFQPESALLMSSALGIYFFARWVTSERVGHFALSCLFISLACLLKIPTLYLGLPLLYLACLKFGKWTLGKWSLWLFVVVVLGALGLWYYHAHQLGASSGLSFGTWQYGTDKWGNWGLVVKYRFWKRLIRDWIASRHLTWFGFPFLFIGLWVKRRTREERLFDYWLAAAVVYFIIVAKGNYAHEYYQLPFILPAVVFMGKAFARHFTTNLRWYRIVILVVALSGIVVSGTIRYVDYMARENPASSDTFKLARVIREKTEADARIVTVDCNDPTLLYLSHRNGWHALPWELNAAFLREKKQAGARYLAGTHTLFDGWDEPMRDKLQAAISAARRVIFNDGHGFILEL